MFFLTRSEAQQVGSTVEVGDLTRLDDDDDDDEILLGGLCDDDSEKRTASSNLFYCDFFLLTTQHYDRCGAKYNQASGRE